jgi:hypothetical protein
MRPLFDDFDEFDFDDNPAVARLMREQRLEESVFSGRKSQGPKHKRQFDDDDDYGDFDDDYDDYDDFEDYEDEDEREYDSYGRSDRDH